MTDMGRAGVGRVKASPFHYRACLALLFVGYCASFFLHKYKLYYFGWAACLLITLTMVLTGKLRLRLTPRHIGALTVFYAYLLLTALWSYSPSETLYYAIADLLQPVAFVIGIVWAQNNPPRRLSEYSAMFVSAHVLIAVTLMVASGGFFFDQYGSIRSALGLALVTGLPMLIWRAKLQRTVLRAALPAVAVLIILVLGSRAALLLAGPVLVASFYAVSEGRLRFLRATARFGVLGLLGVLVIWSVPGLRHGAEAALSRFGPDELSFAITPGGVAAGDIQADFDRRLQAAVALSSFLSRPLTGGGYMSTLSITTAAYGRVGLSAHGLPFTLLGETGLIGTAIFLWFLLGCYRSVRRRLASSVAGTDASFYRILLVTLGAMLLFGAFHQIHQVPSFFVLLGWGYAADRQVLAPTRRLVPDSTAPEPLPTS
jgi:hypothetical protein